MEFWIINYGVWRVFFLSRAAMFYYLDLAWDGWFGLDGIPVSIIPNVTYYLIFIRADCLRSPNLYSLSY